MEDLKSLVEEVLLNQAVIYAKLIKMEKANKGSVRTDHYLNDAKAELAKDREQLKKFG
jgi:hypothetical protein